MLRHHQEGDPSPQITHAPYFTTAAEEKLVPQHDPHIEDFLDRVFARLVAVMPFEERQARRDAMRAQIAETIAAHEELGSTHEDAVALALAQIQREQAVTQQAVRPVLETRSQQPSARSATLWGLGFYGLFYVLDQTRASGHIWSWLIAKLYDHGGSILNAPSVANFYRFELLVLPVVCGLAVGLISKARPVRGSLNALALLAIPAIAWGGVAYGLMYADLFNISQWPEWCKAIFPNPLPAVAGIAFWAALGSLSAATGGWLRRTLPRVTHRLARVARGVTKRSQRSRATLNHDSFENLPASYV
jgi:hypothetical protein